MAKRKNKAAAGRKRKPAAAPRPLSNAQRVARQKAIFSRLEVAEELGTRAATAERMRARTSARLNAMVAARAKQTSQALVKLGKKYEEGAIMRQGSQKAVAKVECVSSGFQPLDDILSGDIDEDSRTIPNTGRGWPRGRIFEVYGPEAAGKTTLALEVIKAYQRVGLVCAFVDAEHALDTHYASKGIGVDMTALLLSQPDSGEEALNLVNDLVDTKAADLIVVDSVANLVPQAELDGEVGDHTPGAQARMMGKALRKLTGKVSKSGANVIFINQLREKIGVMFGNPETTPGGKALKFYASIRLDIRNMGQMKKSQHVVGRRVRLRTVKNKVASPNRDVFAEIRHGQGFTAMQAMANPHKKDDDEDEKATDG